MKRRITSLCTALLTLVMLLVQTPVYAAQLPSGTEDIGAQIEAFYTEFEATAAGMATAVFDEEGELYAGYFGYADKEGGIPVDENTVIEWGSVSKLTVWVSVMQLVEDGRLSLDEDIRTYLPGGFFKRLKYENDRITMLNLMNHNAGFEDTIIGMSTPFDADIVSLEEYVTSCQPAQIWHPNEVVAYSNWGCTLAAYIVERVSGEPFWQYAQEHIFAPLGMEHTAINADLSDNPAVQAKRQELQCYLPDGTLYPNCNIHIIMYPAGMCTSTLQDFETFAQALLARDDRLLRRISYIRLYEPSLYYTNSDIPRNCHGLWCEEYGVRVVGHGGNTKGCSSYLRLDLENGVGMVVMTNQAGESTFNTVMPELVFGRYEGEHTAAGIAYSGFAKSTRTAWQGPLSIERAFSWMYVSPALADSLGSTFIYETPTKLEMNIMDLNTAGVMEVVPELLLAAVWLLTAVIALIVLLIKLIKRIFRRRTINPLHRWHTLMCWLLFLPPVVLLALFILLSEMIMWRPIVYRIIFACYIVMALLAAYGALYGMRKFSEEHVPGRIRFRNAMTIIGGLLTFASIAYWQLWAFWTV